MTPQENRFIKKYLHSLRKSLKHLSEADRSDIIAEIQSHLLERWETDSGSDYNEASLKAILARMGPADEMAARYCEQRGWAKPPKRHPVRNILLTVVALFLLTFFGLGYFGYRVVSFVFRDRDNAVRVEDGKINILDGTVEIGDGKVNIEGKIEINDDSISIGTNGFFGLKEISRREDKDVFTTEGISAVVLEGKNGSIEVVGSDDNTITIHSTKKIYGKEGAAGAPGAIDALKLTSENVSGTLTLEVFYPDAWPKDVTGAHLDMVVRLPKNLVATISTKNGQVSVSGMEKNVVINARNGRVDVSHVGHDVTVETHNGAVSTKNVGGSLRVNTHNGSIEASDVHGDISLTTHNGSAALDLLQGYEFEFSATTHHGVVETDFPTRGRNGSYTATIGSGIRRVDIATRHGSIRVKQ